MSNGLPPGEGYEPAHQDVDSRGAESAQPPWSVAPAHSMSYADSLPPSLFSVPVKRRRFPRLIVGIVSLIVLVAGLGAFGIGYEYLAVRNQGNAPATVLRQFCDAEVRQDYQTAYTFLTPAYRKQFSVHDWEQLQVQRDQTKGTIQSCSDITRILSYGLGQSHATFDVTLTYPSTFTERGYVTLEFAADAPGYGSSGQLNDPHHWFVDVVESVFRPIS